MAKVEKHLLNPGQTASHMLDRQLQPLGLRAYASTNVPRIDLFGASKQVGLYNTFALHGEHDEFVAPGAGPIRVSRDATTGQVHALRGPGLASAAVPSGVHTHSRWPSHPGPGTGRPAHSSGNHGRCPSLHEPPDRLLSRRAGPAAAADDTRPVPAAVRTDPARRAGHPTGIRQRRAGTTPPASHAEREGAHAYLRRRGRVRTHTPHRTESGRFTEVEPEPKLVNN